MLLIAKPDWIDRGEPAHDGERRDMRLGREPALDRRQMRIELGRHAYPFLVTPFRLAMCGAHFGGLGRRAKRPRKPEWIGREWGGRHCKTALGDPLAELVLCRADLRQQCHRIETAIGLAQPPLDGRGQLGMSQRSLVPTTKVREVSHMLKAIHAQESRDAADRKARAIVDDLRAARMNTAADLVERSISETLTYYAFPDIHWQKIRTNNPLERIMKEIRRRTRVVGAFPDGQSCLNLAAARLRYIAGTAWSAKCYMNMRPLYQPQVMQTEAVA